QVCSRTRKLWILSRKRRLQKRAPKPWFALLRKWPAMITVGPTTALAWWCDWGRGSRGTLEEWAVLGRSRSENGGGLRSRGGSKWAGEVLPVTTIRGFLNKDIQRIDDCYCASLAYIVQLMFRTVCLHIPYSFFFPHVTGVAFT